MREVNSGTVSEIEYLTRQIRRHGDGDGEVHTLPERQSTGASGDGFIWKINKNEKNSYFNMEYTLIYNVKNKSKSFYYVKSLNKDINNRQIQFLLLYSIYVPFQCQYRKNEKQTNNESVNHGTRQSISLCFSADRAGFRAWVVSG